MFPVILPQDAPCSPLRYLSGNERALLLLLNMAGPLICFSTPTEPEHLGIDGAHTHTHKHTTDG